MTVLYTIADTLSIKCCVIDKNGVLVYGIAWKKIMRKIILHKDVMNFRLDLDDRPESKIQKSIMDYLKTVPCSNFRKIAQGAYSTRGVVDILGCFHGRSVVMEVKRRTTEPTELQKKYLNDNIEAQGFSAVVRSVADVREVLRTVEKRICE